MTPSTTSLTFVEERAVEIECDTSPQRIKERYRKMYRHRRRDYRMWHYRSIGELGKAVKECRWRAARTWGNLLRGV